MEPPFVTAPMGGDSWPMVDALKAGRRARGCVLTNRYLLLHASFLLLIFFCVY